MANNIDIIRKLPGVYRTPTEEKFFGATFDQVFSPRNSAKLDGFVGRRVSGSYDPIDDFYLPEPNKNRTRYQLEPIAVTRDKDTFEKTNQYFYDDIVNKLRSLEAETGNHDRLFNSDFYAYSAPIDADKYVNYDQYYWYPDGLPVVTISGIDDAVIASNIIGQTGFNTDDVGASPANVEFKTGMRIRFLGSSAYDYDVIVEGVGKSIGLFEFKDSVFLNDQLEFLPWDPWEGDQGEDAANYPESLEIEKWDSVVWDAVPGNLPQDYITMERNSVDGNAWSRSNAWYHISAITETESAINGDIPLESAQATRPIIEFFKNTMLYRAGTKYLSDVNYLIEGNAYTDIHQRNVNDVKSIYELSSLKDGDILVFPDDTTPVQNLLPWDAWDGPQKTDGGFIDKANDSPGDPMHYPEDEYMVQKWDVTPDGPNTDRSKTGWDFLGADYGGGDPSILSKNYLWQASIGDNSIVTLSIYNPVTKTTGDINDTISEGDTVLVTDGLFIDSDRELGNKGESWYYDGDVWHEAYKQKTGVNQSLLFQLYDTSGVSLDDQVKYPDNDFNGNEIFSYVMNDEDGALVDDVLGLPLTYYTDDTDISVVMFENDLTTNRNSFVENNTLTPIIGYYYYRTISDSDTSDSSTWTLDNSWYLSDVASRQSVIDQHVVIDTSVVRYRISVNPVNTNSSNNPDITLLLNGSLITEGIIYEVIEGRPFINLESIQLELNDTIEIRTYTYDNLPEDSTGYFEIPQQLEGNPRNDEVDAHAYEDFAVHYSSVISNQHNFIGDPTGNNNYSNTERSPDKGEFIVQNKASLLKTMFVSSSDELDVIEGLRFARDEYTRFKNKFINNVKILSDRGFTPNIINDEVDSTEWFEEILGIITISKEFSNAFGYSYMIARGTTYASESITVDISNPSSLDNYVDVSDSKNVVYLYKTRTVNATDYSNSYDVLLVEGVDFVLYNDIESETLIAEFTNNTVSSGDAVAVRMYKDPAPSYIPATPAKLGMSPLHIPKITLDTTYSQPAFVIVGHDGTITPTYGEYDVAEFISSGKVQPITIVKNDAGIIVSSTNDYRDTLLLELETRIYNGSISLFKDDYAVPMVEEEIRPGFYRSTDINRYNAEEYTNIASSLFFKWTVKTKSNYTVNEFYDPGNWKTWNYADNGVLPLKGNWRGIFLEYYDTFTPDTTPWEMLGFANAPIWWESEYGTNYSSNNTKLWEDLESGLVRQGNRAGINELYARNGLSSVIPVSPSGSLRTPASIFALDSEGDWDNVNGDWVFGDMAPVEYAWYTSAEYQFALIELFYMTRPSVFGEKLWNTADSITVRNEQLVDRDTLFRQRNEDIVVHGEKHDNEVIVKFGYQQYITDRLLYLGKDATTDFGSKVRNLGVNLAYKMAAFTNKDTITIQIENKSTNSVASSPIVPDNNYEVFLHTGESVGDFVYSGVIVRSLSDRTFDVHGYDVSGQSFNIIPRSVTSKQIHVSQGGTPASFEYFEFGKKYTEYTYVKYNDVFYACLETHVASSFMSSKWQRLSSLPETGGVSVSYRPQGVTSGEIVNVPYGTVFRSEQEVFDFLIGYGDYLESRGWNFDDVNTITNVSNNWLTSANRFLFWAVNEWETNNSLTLSPSASAVTLQVPIGYPSHVERLSNGVYSILDKNGIAISPNDTVINREDQLIQVVPTDASVGIAFFRVSSAETEHVIVFDNITDFDDIIYEPLLSVRRNRLKFTGIKTSDWFGKLQASGYLVQGNSLIQNFDNVVQSFTNYYNTEDFLDNTQLEDAARHLTGYENKDYLDALGISDDVQYNFYQGFVRDKGTRNAIDKILRTESLRNDQTVDVYEDWAFKLAEFGGVCDNNTIEFLVKYNEVKSDPQVVRVNYKHSVTGYVGAIELYNADTIYSRAPIIEIAPPVTGVTATAIAVLGTDKHIAEINVTNPGSGYTEAPTITISPDTTVVSGITVVPDIAYAIFQPDIVSDDPIDDIIEIDVDNNELWLYGPNSSQQELDTPTTEDVYYQIPNAGYVNTNDVTVSTFNRESALSLWDSVDISRRLVESDTMWIAKTQYEDWNVYKSTELGTVTLIRNNDQDVIEIETNISWLNAEIDSNNTTIAINNENIANSELALEDAVAFCTDEGNDPGAGSCSNQAVIDQLTTSIADWEAENISLSSQNAEYESTLTSQEQALITERSLSDLAIADVTWGMYGEYTMLPGYFDSMTRYYGFEFDGQDPTSRLLSGIVNTIHRESSVTKNRIDTFMYSDEYDRYFIVDDDGEPLKFSDNFEVGSDVTETQYLNFISVRFKNASDYDVFDHLIDSGDLVWIDSDDTGNWLVARKTGTVLTEYVKQSVMTDTTLYENAFLRDRITADTIVRLPVYDPFKGIIAGQADQNIDIKSSRDPARYTNASDEVLIDTDNLFGISDVGKVWWDLSGCRYMYYEYPNTEYNIAVGDYSDNLAYRKDNWGKLFPGSTISIYEWTESTDLPTNYTGDGVPRNTTDYVVSSVFNSSTGLTQNYYYFWTTNRITIPENDKNRTLPTTTIARLIENPRSQGYQWFAPLQANDINVSYTIANSDNILSNRNTVVQINYKSDTTASEVHTQWELLREGDPTSVVPDAKWNKMVDSLIGFTDLLPVEEYGSVRSAVDIGEEGFVILPVPDPSLSNSEKLGIGIRPQQSMFSDIYGARKVLSQVSNKLFAPIQMWEDTDVDTGTDWTFDYINSNIYWSRVDWFATGFDETNTVTTVQVETYQELVDMKNNGAVIDEAVFRVYPFKPSATDRYKIWQYREDINDFVLVRRENGTIAYNDSVYSEVTLARLNTELREILYECTHSIFVDDRSLGLNLIFFAMVNYAFSEQQDITWAFKTSYLTMGRYVDQDTQNDFVDDMYAQFLDYVDNAKAYRSKIRDTISHSEIN